ncbi:hypothetical protein Pint_09894 [Pistacia integerrima]|uniref:Uncharacterized protein n=1 Tax=Pistacia integerrima TaxID=434235 RepID=A0ACC0XJX1_9ROSI|nr:hypothetical protein Pint_09894 [Pistacia integerrima]
MFLTEARGGDPLCDVLHDYGSCCIISFDISITQCFLPKLEVEILFVMYSMTMEAAASSMTMEAAASTIKSKWLEDHR